MRAALAPIALVLAACPSNLEEQSHVGKLRVLAMRADPAELILDLDAGLPATTLTALAVQPDGGPIAVSFALCKELGGAPSPTLPCPGEAGIALPDAGALAARLDLSDPDILAFAAEAQLDGGAFDAGGIAASLDEGVPLLIGFRAASGAEVLDGFDSITLRSPARGPADVNPPPFDLQIGDGSPVNAGEKVRLLPVTAPKDDVAKRYGFSFFATAGKISSLRSTDTTATGETTPTGVDWTAPAPAPLQPVIIWVVLRDGRGGVAWGEWQVQVR